MLLTLASHPDPFEANGMPPTYDSMHYPFPSSSTSTDSASFLRSERWYPCSLISIGSPNGANRTTSNRTPLMRPISRSRCPGLPVGLIRSTRARVPGVRSESRFIGLLFPGVHCCSWSFYLVRCRRPPQQRVSSCGRTRICEAIRWLIATRAPPTWQIRLVLPASFQIHAFSQSPSSWSRWHKAGSALIPQIINCFPDGAAQRFIGNTSQNPVSSNDHAGNYRPLPASCGSRPLASSARPLSGSGGRCRRWNSRCGARIKAIKVAALIVAAASGCGTQGTAAVADADRESGRVCGRTDSSRSFQLRNPRLCSCCRRLARMKAIDLAALIDRGLRLRSVQLLSKPLFSPQLGISLNIIANPFQLHLVANDVIKVFAMPQPPGPT
jgi:hypothetical protein